MPESLQGALAPVKAELRAVSERILSQVADPVVRKVVYLIAAGGKRLRPALVLLTGASGPSPDREALIETATAVELIHTATLIHDDIIDQSPLRRSRPTFHQRWGTERAVLMGDYLYAAAFTLLARLKAPEVIRVMADVCRQLCRGELREVEARYRLDLTEDEYFEIIGDKTASLVGGCCHSGAVLGGCAPAAVRRFAEFGVRFGLAFQIIDDCLDLTGDPRRLGKAVCADVDKGALSLPMIYLTQRLSVRERNRLFAPLQAGTADAAFVVRVAKTAKSAGAIAKAQERARVFVQLAMDSIAKVPVNGLASAYEQLAEYAISRRS